MSETQVPDYRYHTQVPLSQVMDLIANKPMREAQLQGQNLQNQKSSLEIAQSIGQAAGGVVSGMVSMAKERQRSEAMKDIGSMMTSGNNMVSGPVTPATPPSSAFTNTDQVSSLNLPTGLGDQPTPSGQGAPAPLPRIPYKTTPEYEGRMLKDLSVADPQEFSKQALELAFSERLANAKAGGASAGKMGDQKFQVKDPVTNMLKTVVANKDAAGNLIHPLTGAPIKSKEDLLTLPEAGFAQSRQAVGTTTDGKQKPVYFDARGGFHYTLEKQPDGSEVATPYEGKVGAKLQNAPASMVDAMANLTHSQNVLVKLGKDFAPAFVGPIAGRAGSMAKYFDTLSTEKQQQFYGYLNEYKNALIRSITGAQLNKDEVPRILAQMPDVNSSPKAFLLSLRRAWDSTQDLIKEKQRAMGAGGYEYNADNLANSDEIDSAMSAAWESMGKGDTTTVADDALDGVPEPKPGKGLSKAKADLISLIRGAK